MPDSDVATGPRGFDVSQPITDPEHLLARQGEVRQVANLIQAQPPPAVLVVGPSGGGRSSVLRCAVALFEREGGVVAHWRPTYADLKSDRVAVRSLLSAIVEATPSCDSSSILSRWRSRVWLGDVSVPPDPLELTSGLALARAIDEGPLDQHVLVADLKRLREMRGLGAPSVVVLDDADDVCEDIEGFERLLAVLHESGWALLMAGTTRSLRAWQEGHSSARRSVYVLRLRRPGLDAVLDLLTDGERHRDLLPSGSSGNQFALANEVGRLTGWLPVLIVLVGRALVSEAEVRKSKIELTVSSLRRAMWTIEAVTRHRPELQTLQRLNAEQVARALALVPLSALTPEQVAVLRQLGLDRNPDRRLDLTRGLALNEAAVLAVEEEFSMLEQDGVFEAGANGGVVLVGGAAAKVFYEVAARERSKGERGLEFFARDYAAIIGGALISSIVEHAVIAAGGGRILGSLEMGPSVDGPSAGDVLAALEHSPRQLADLFLIAPEAGLPAIQALTSERARILLISARVNVSGSAIEQALVVALDGDQTEHSIAEHVMAGCECAEALMADLGVRWAGCNPVIFADEAARLALASLVLPDIGGEIVQQYAQGAAPAALALADLALEAIARHGVSTIYGARVEAQLHHQRGFLRLIGGDAAKARDDFEAAPDGDEPWLRRWNIAIAAALEKDLPSARTELDAADELLSREPVRHSEVHMVGAVAGRLVQFALEDVDAADVRELVEAQRRMLSADSRDSAGALLGTLPTSATVDAFARSSRALLDLW